MTFTQLNQPEGEHVGRGEGRKVWKRFQGAQGRGWSPREREEQEASKQPELSKRVTALQLRILLWKALNRRRKSRKWAGFWPSSPAAREELVERSVEPGGHGMWQL